MTPQTIEDNKLPYCKCWIKSVIWQKAILYIWWQEDLKNLSFSTEWTEIISDDYVHSQNQVVDELNTKNNLLKNDVDELNKQIIEQAQQLTGTKRLPSDLY